MRAERLTSKVATDVFGILGTVVAGAYQVDAVVAEGGFGVVYRAYHAGFRAPVALKCLKIPQSVTGAHAEEFLEQFRAEAELLFRLSAGIPTVVRPLHVDAMTAPDGSFVPFMALEWLDGETLEAVVARRKAEGRPALSLKKLVRLLTPVARALERAHNFAGPDGPISIVHRDLKPENIFLAQVAGEEVVKILDFGIGKAKSVASQVAGRASQVEGALASFTPAYGAPEQWVPKRFGQTGPWTDVWGLALTLVEVMAARPIIDGDQAAMMGTALDASRRPTPRTEGVDLSDDAERVFARALALDPRERYQDAGLFWNDLVAAAGVEGDTVAVSRRRRDLRAEGDGAVPRVEQIEAAMPERSVRPPPAVDRAAATLAAPVETVGAQPTGGAPGSVRLPSPFARPVPVSQSGEYRAVAQAVAPAAAATGAPHRDHEIPDLDLHAGARGAPPDLGAPPAASDASLAPVVGAAPASLIGGGGRVLDSGGGAVNLALDIEPGDRPAARGSGQMSAVRAPGSGEHRAVSANLGGAAPRPSGIETDRVPDSRGVARAGVMLRAPVVPSDADSPMARFRAPAVLIGVGIVITVANQVYAGATGEVLALGPLRASVIATVIVLSGVALLAWSLLPKR